MKNSHRGFTLIELLVVISIIALFTSISFATLTGVRSRAQETTIKSNLKNIKSQAELAFNNTGDYSTASSAVSAIIDGINKSGGTASFYTIDNTHYAVSAKLNSDPTKNWSVSDQANIVMWDTADISSTRMTWSGLNNANDACINAGKRLPTIEELQTLYNAGGITTARNFSADTYWSSTEYTPDPNKARYFYYNGYFGVLGFGPKSSTYSHVRCVR